MNNINKPSFNFTLSKEIQFHLDINNEVEVFSKKNISYDRKGSHGYIFHLKNVEKLEESTRFVVKVTENKKENSEGAKGFLLNKYDFSFFPKFIKIKKISKNKQERVGELTDFKFLAMSYCGESLVEMIEKKVKFNITEVMLKIIEIFKELEKNNLYYWDLHLSNVCINEEKIFLVDVESIKDLNFENTFEIVHLFCQDLIKNTNYLINNVAFKKSILISKSFDDLYVNLANYKNNIIIEDVSDIDEREFESSVESSKVSGTQNDEISNNSNTSIYQGTSNRIDEEEKKRKLKEITTNQNNNISKKQKINKNKINIIEINENKINIIDPGSKILTNQQSDRMGDNKDNSFKLDQEKPFINDDKQIMSKEFFNTHLKKIDGENLKIKNYSTSSEDEDEVGYDYYSKNLEEFYKKQLETSLISKFYLIFKMIILKMAQGTKANQLKEMLEKVK